MGGHVFKSSETSGVYHLSAGRWTTVEGAAEKENFCLLKVEIPHHASKDKVLAQIGADLGFPGWYGANFDALFDCLTDAAWQPANGLVIMIKGISEFRAMNPECLTTLIEVFKAAAEARKEAGDAFWILLDSPARSIPQFPAA